MEQMEKNLLVICAEKNRNAHQEKIKDEECCNEFHQF